MRFRIVRSKPILTILRRQKQALTKRYGIESLDVFGSYAPGEQKTSSDLGLRLALYPV
jgi:predicted nucleotidyltransferase